VVKVMGKGRDGPILILGLDDDAIERLKQGIPAYVDLAEAGMKGRKVIVYNKQLDGIIKDLIRAGFISDDGVDEE
jgi:hypothetical protein